MDFNELNKEKKEKVPKKPSVSKTKTIREKRGNGRELAIKACEVEGCNGQPKNVTNFTIPGFCGKKCEDCYIVISYERA